MVPGWLGVESSSTRRAVRIGRSACALALATVALWVEKSRDAAIRLHGAGGTDRRTQPSTRLADGLKRLAEETFGDVPAEVEIRWVTIRAGFGFTAGKPSTSSLIARSVPTGSLTRSGARSCCRVSDLWQQVTGCHPDEVVVTTLDGPLPLL
jgi:hypothetical protein